MKFLLSAYIFSILLTVSSLFTIYHFLPYFIYIYVLCTHIAIICNVHIVVTVLAILIVITAYSHKGIYHAFVMDEIFNISYNTFQSFFYHNNTFLASPLWVHKYTSLKTQFSQWKYFSSILIMESNMQSQREESNLSSANLALSISVIILFSLASIILYYSTIIVIQFYTTYNAFILYVT